MKSLRGLLLPEEPAEICDPKRCALIVYDMQIGIIDQVSKGRQVLKNTLRLVEAARSRRFPIFFTRHFFLPKRIAGVGQLRRAMIWQQQTEPSELKQMIPYGSAAFQVAPELQPQAEEVLVDKISMSAFESTFLNVAMRDAQIDSFLITGIALEIGIEPTVRHSLDLNYLPIVVSDACGAKSNELKSRSLDTLSQTGEVKVWTTDEAVTAMRASHDESTTGII